LKKLQVARAEWIESQRGKVNQRDATWAEAVATGSREFVEEVEEIGNASEGAQRSTAERRICSQRNDRIL
jgi:hypothetical protein